MARLFIWGCSGLKKMEDKRENLDIWRQGVSLNEALDEFCDRQACLKIQNLNKPQIPPQKKTPSITDVMEPIQQMLNYKSTVYGLKRDSLFKNIYSGKLIAVGYSCPRKSTNLPEEIPHDMWSEENINWGKSSIKGNGLEFVSVRVAKKIREGINSNNRKLIPNIEVVDKRSGRPSKWGLIIEAYNFLEKNGKINCSRTLKSHTKIIQETVRVLHPEIKDNKGMQEETVRRAILDRFEKYCATSKPTSKL